MYGPKRIVLGSKAVTLSGLKLIELKGGGGCNPLGFWYESGGKFYADLKSKAQWWSGGPWLTNKNIGNKGLGGVATKKALREFVMAYAEKEKP